MRAGYNTRRRYCDSKHTHHEIVQLGILGIPNSRESGGLVHILYSASARENVQGDERSNRSAASNSPKLCTPKVLLQVPL